jgi:hypothetical protein
LNAAHAWFTCYFHPWEMDTGQPVIDELSPLTKLRHYGGIRRFEDKVDHFLQTFTFVPLREAAAQTFGSEVQTVFSRAQVARKRERG